MTKPPPALPPVRSVYPMNHRRRMTDAEVNHLRRVLGYVRCEIGQAPDEMRDMLVSIAAKLGPVTDPAAQERVIEGMEHSLRVPEYIRAAVKSLARLTEEMHGTTLEGEAEETETYPAVLPGFATPSELRRKQKRGKGKRR